LNLSNLGLSVPILKEEPAPIVVAPPPPPPTPAVTSPTKVFSKFFSKLTPTSPTVTPPVAAEKPQDKPVVTEKPQQKPVVTEKPQPKPIVTEKQKNKPVVVEKPQNKPVVAEKPQTKPVKEEKTPIKAATPENPTAITATDVAEKPLIRQLMPWLILLGVALFGLLCLRTCRSSAGDAPTTVPVAETPKTDTAAQNQTTTAEGTGNEKTLKLTDGEIKVKQGSFLDLLYTVLTDAAADTTKPLIFDNVNFEKNKTELTDGSKAQLNDLVKIMKAYTNFQVKINGYTDSRGDADENKKLSSGRAAAVKAYLTAHDIYEERIKTEGFGAANPITSNETEEGRVKNRRIEAKVTKK
jgi:outer membrane protein OmpA-like peptidoglycan-associated protein